MTIGDKSTLYKTKQIVGKFGDWVSVPYNSDDENSSLADISNEGHNLFVKNPVEEEIDSSAAIDVYVISPSGDAKIKVETP